MGFRENLKAELAYADMLVKELAELSGINKQTIDSYLRENGHTPSVEAAVRIARALNVSVEYLVTGQEAKTSKFFEGQDHDLRLFLQSLKNLSTDDRKIVIKNAKNLAEILIKKNGK